MIFAYPDFYPDFHCIAEKCRHNCCKGWEIDIDPESRERYRNIADPFGELLKKNISDDPTPHFVLTPEENCPFLTEKGLCRMIIELGEESLCDICTEHPRFYNEYEGRIEAGLGLCCEEAVRLLTAKNTPLRILEEDDGEASSPLPAVLKFRKRVFEILGNTTLPLTARTERVLKLAGEKPVVLTARETAAFYMQLEQMEPAWGKMLTCLQQTDFAEPEGIRYERIAEYFLYRHLTEEYEATAIPTILRFAFLSTKLVCTLEQLGFGDEALRLYSAEIEYSDENVMKLLEFLS